MEAAAADCIAQQQNKENIPPNSHQDQINPVVPSTVQSHWRKKNVGVIIKQRRYRRRPLQDITHLFNTVAFHQSTPPPNTPFADIFQLTPLVPAPIFSRGSQKRKAASGGDIRSKTVSLRMGFR